MSCLGDKVKPVQAWMIVNYRWKIPYPLSSTIRRTRAEAIKTVTDQTGWTWKQHRQLKMRAIKVMVMPE